MEATDNDANCQKCQLNGIRLKTKGMDIEGCFRWDDASIFLHEPCPKCDNTELDPSLRLCEACRHFRIWHLLTCRGQITWNGNLEHCYKSLGHCDFCYSVISAAEEFGRGHGEILHLQDVDSVKFALRSHSVDGLMRCNLYMFRVSFDGKEKPFAGDHEYIVDTTDRPIDRAFFEAGVSSFSHPEKNTKALMSRLHPYIDWSQHRTWFGSLPLLRSSEDSPGGLLLRQPLQEVRVVDVVDACIVHLPREAEFVALSYVWGPDSANDFRTLRTNLRDLEIPGSLDRIDLPSTISDAITVCKQLEHRFLWIDRLCIIQDELYAEAIQLEQMASLYHQAALTIVAAAGSNAAHGLLGVSRARVEQKQLKFHSRLQLVKTAPDLKQVLRKTTWNSRAWTFQEYLSSTTMMFFTEHGLFVGHRSEPGSLDVYTEAPAVHQSTYDRLRNSFDALETYTAKSLTHSSDRLRGFSGILYATHGNRTTYGVPIDDFDRSILWRRRGSRIEPRTQEQENTIPTWSWTSVGGPIELYQKYCYSYSLAYWGRFVYEEDRVVKVVIGPPKRTCQVRREGNDHAVAALAWLAGCVRSKPPSYLKIDCSSTEYEKRLEERWSDDDLPGYWEDAFREYKADELFESVRGNFKDITRHIIVHTQKASFTLDRSSRMKRKTLRPWVHPENATILIRSNGLVAGAIELDEGLVDSNGNRKVDHCDVDLIALSVDPESHIFPPVIPCFDSPSDSSSLSEFFGCICSSNGTINLEPEAHLAECPKHVDFDTPSPYCEPLSPEGRFTPGQRQTEKARAFVKHWEGLNYFGIDGSPIHDLQYIPELYVMAVAPVPVQEDGDVIYRRLGIGRVYLKRWVEASPKFETIVLE